MGKSFSWHWTWLIIFAGLLLGAGYLWNFMIELQTLDVFWPPLLAFLIGMCLSIGLIYIGIRISYEEWIDPNRERRIVGWSLGGLFVVTTLRGATILIRNWEGRAVAEPQLDILVSMSGGLLAGLVGGYFYERADHEAETARQARNAVTFLNRTIRHECLNGLSIIQGNIERLRQEFPDDDLQKSLDVIQSRSEDMSDMIQNVRMFMRTYTGRDELTRVNLTEILNNGVVTIRGAYPAAEVTADVPSNLRVQGNEGLKFVFSNLLENAVEHNDKDTPEVSVTASTHNNTITVNVADNGPGIPDELKNRVFEPELDRDHRFGLYLVHRLVTYYDGTIDVMDNDPEGTVVTVQLPQASY